MQDINETQKPTTGNQDDKQISSDSWHFYRKIAGILTVIVGFQFAHSQMVSAMADGAYNFLGRVLSGGGIDVNLLTTTIPPSGIAGAIISIIGAILFSLKKQRGRFIIWVAAVAPIPIAIMTNYHFSRIPGQDHQFDYYSFLIALIMSVMLIWILRGSNPKRDVIAPTKVTFWRGSASLLIFLVVSNFAYTLVTANPELFDNVVAADIQDIQKSLAEGADPNETSYSGTTPLMVALESPIGQDKALLLLEYGASPNTISKLEFPEKENPVGISNRHWAEPEWVHTPIQVAVRRGWPDVVIKMIDKGVNLNSEPMNLYEKNIIELAMNRYFDGRRDEVLTVLIESGAEVPEDILLLQHSDMDNMQPNILELLLKNGANPNAVDTNSPFRWNVMGNFIKELDPIKIKLLLDHGGNPDSVILDQTLDEWLDNRMSMARAKDIKAKYVSVKQLLEDARKK